MSQTEQADVRVVLVTVSSEDEATKVARGLVERKLAACVNVVPGVRSIYRWQGEVKEDRELLLVVKTREELLAKVVDAVKSLHSYTVPETIALPVVGGASPYLSWVREETR
jgi:periplasmic divalent cation tolerance protein